MVNSTHCSKNGEADVKGFSIDFVATVVSCRCCVYSGKTMRKLEPSTGRILSVFMVLCNSVFLQSSGMQS